LFALKKLLAQFLLHKKRRKPRLLGRENVKEKQPAPIYSVRGISSILCKHDLRYYHSRGILPYPGVNSGHQTHHAASNLYRTAAYYNLIGTRGT
jgi:hypothetical protein